MKRIDVMRQLNTEEMAMTLVSLLAPRIEQVTGKPLADEELEVAAESWVNWLESEHPETREKLYTKDILTIKFNKDETNFLSEDDWDIIKALERMSKADPEGFMSQVLKLVERLQRRCDGERKARYNLINQRNELKSEISILTDANKNLQELYQEEQAKVEKAKQKVIDAFKKLNTAKSEAVREFAEMLKEHSCNLTEYDEGGWSDTVSAVKVEDIDRLLGEVGAQRCLNTKI